MPKHYFRASDADWQKITAAAEAQGETTSAWIRRVLIAAADGYA